MNASHQLDRLVGEHVIGLRLANDGERQPCYWLEDADGLDYTGRFWLGSETAWAHCPDFSANIAWAWRVVERIEEKVRLDDRHFLLFRDLVGWTAATYYAWTDNLQCSADGTTAPEAICRLALAVFGVEVAE